MFNKLIYTVLAVASLGAFAACTSSPDDSVETPAAQVQFRVSDVSRSSLTNNDNIKTKPFAVYGDMVSSTAAAGTVPTKVFDNTPVTHNGTKWVYDNLQYWFPGQTYSFVAVHPSDNSAVISDLKYENSSVSFTYKYPENYSAAVDVLTATHRRRYQTGNPHAVAFEFGHILARLNFVAKVDPTAQSSIVIERLALVNVSNQATYSVTPASTTTETSDKIGGWSAYTAPNAKLFEWTGPVEIQKEGSYEFFPITGKNTDPLLIIPQSVDPNLEVQITYRSTGSDSSSKDGKSKLFSTAVTAHGGLWVAGQSYTYNFTLGDNDVIIFNAPTIQDWADAEGANYVVID